MEIEGGFLRYAEFKAPKGVIKVELELSDDVISSLALSGDFFLYPEEAIEQLEKTLRGVRAERASLLAVVREFYSSSGVRTPMLEPKHWVEAILKAAGS